MDHPEETTLRNSIVMVRSSDVLILYNTRTTPHLVVFKFNSFTGLWGGESQRVDDYLEMVGHCDCVSSCRGSDESGYLILVITCRSFLYCYFCIGINFGLWSLAMFFLLVKEMCSLTKS